MIVDAVNKACRSVISLFKTRKWWDFDKMTYRNVIPDCER